MPIASTGLEFIRRALIQSTAILFHSTQSLLRLKLAVKQIFLNFSVSVLVCSFYILYYSLQEGIGCKLKALNVKLTKLIFEIGWPSYHLTSWRKSVLIQKPLAHISKAFHQHRIAEKSKMI